MVQSIGKIMIVDIKKSQHIKNDMIIPSINSFNKIKKFCDSQNPVLLSHPINSRNTCGKESLCHQIFHRVK